MVKNFDIVIPLGPNDIDVIVNQIQYTKKFVSNYNNIYLISYDPKIKIKDCITIDEKIFPFNLDDVKNIKKIRDKKAGWYLQQLLKFYAVFYIPNIMDTILVIDCDTFFLKKTKFFKHGKCLYNYCKHYHQPYFNHMKNLSKKLTQVDKNKSGICHHMMFQKKYLKKLFKFIESRKMHSNKHFYQIFLDCIYDRNTPCASEYEIYFNFMLNFYPDKVIIRKLKFKNVTNLESYLNQDYDYLSCHHYMRDSNK